VVDDRAPQRQDQEIGLPIAGEQSAEHAG
jgi:hypothetical protein